MPYWVVVPGVVVPGEVVLGVVVPGVVVLEPCQGYGRRVPRVPPVSMTLDQVFMTTCRKLHDSHSDSPSFKNNRLGK